MQKLRKKTLLNFIFRGSNTSNEKKNVCLEKIGLVKPTQADSNVKCVSYASCLPHQ